jgi:FkbM family methyltransferase
MKINQRQEENRFIRRLRLIRMVFGLASFVRGKPITRLIDWLCYFAADKTNRLQVVAPYHGNLLMHLDVQSWVERKILCTGYYESWVADFLSRALKPGHVALDIGANVGCHTLVMASAVGNQGRVIAFEPNPRILTRLRSNVLLNRFEHVELLTVALSDNQGRSSIFIPPELDHNQGLASMHRANLGEACEEVSVEVELLDDVVREKNLTRVDLIKMDVEGHEWRVLQGARKTLERFKPVLVFEFSQRQWNNAGFSPEQVEEFLSDLGYDLFVMRKEYTMRIHHGVAAHGDLLALPR